MNFDRVFGRQFKKLKKNLVQISQKNKLLKRKPMLTTKEINALPLGVHHNSSLRKKFGPKHGTPVKFQDDKGKIHTFISNRWWARHRKKNPLRSSRAKKQNIQTEFEQVYGKNKSNNINWFGQFLKGFKKWLGL